MSQYTTSEVLEMMETWVAARQKASDFEEDRPFKGFDGLLGADLDEIDLSRDTLRARAEEWRRANAGKPLPRWASPVTGGINLAGAALSEEPSGKRASLRGAQLQGACLEAAQIQGARLDNAQLQGARLEGAQLQGTVLWSAQLQGARLDNAQLQGAYILAAQLQGARLNSAQLQGAHLDNADMQEADLTGAQLQGANIEGARLEGAQLQGADFQGARLQGASLGEAQLQGARFQGAQLQGATLYGVELGEARLEDADWGDGFVLGEERAGRFKPAEAVYRQLKRYYARAGQYDLAGEFHVREMTMRRKRLWYEAIDDPLGRAQARSSAFALLVFQLSSGYGERPARALGWAALCWISFAVMYWLGDFLGLKQSLTSLAYLQEALYYSALPFASYAPPGTAGVVSVWARGVGAIEGVIAFFLLSLFLVTFVRKLSRM